MEIGFAQLVEPARLWLSNLKQIGWRMRLYANDIRKLSAQRRDQGLNQLGRNLISILKLRVRTEQRESPGCPRTTHGFLSVDFSPTNFTGNSNVLLHRVGCGRNKPNLLLTGDRHLNLPRTKAVLNLTSTCRSIGRRNCISIWGSRNTGNSAGRRQGAAQVNGKQLRALLRDAA